MSDGIKQCYLVLDESGAMHLKDERYFVIAGYLTTDINKIKSCHRKIEKEILTIKKIDLHNHKELKSTNITPKQQATFINNLLSIDGVIGVSITIDKYQLDNFKASENLAYNYFVKNLINYLLNCNIVILNEAYDVVLLLDNRSIAVKNANDLETFLNLEFVYSLAYDKNFIVKYLDSNKHREIQMADYISNALWKSYNLDEHKILYHLDMSLFKLIKQSKFPFKTFGINPPKFKIDKKAK